MARKNRAVALIDTGGAPSPATSGTSITVVDASGLYEGACFLRPHPFDPFTDDLETAVITNISSETLTVGRDTDGRGAQSVLDGWEVVQGPTGAEADAWDAKLGVAEVAPGGVTPADDELDLSGSTDGHVLTIQSDGKIAFEAPPAAGMTNPMTTGGDIIYGGASGVPTRLANGSAGQALLSAGGTSAPTWGAAGVDWTKTTIFSYVPDPLGGTPVKQGASTTTATNNGMQVNTNAGDVTGSITISQVLNVDDGVAFFDSTLYGRVFLRYLPARTVVFGAGIGDVNTNNTSTSAYNTKGVGIRNDGSNIVFRNGTNSAEATTSVSASLAATSTLSCLVELAFNPTVNAKITINGSLTATHTTSLPSGNNASSTPPFMGLRMYTSSAAHQVTFGTLGLIRIKP